MKYCSLLLAFLLGLNSSTYAQADPDALRIAVGGSFAKPKIMPKLEKFAIAQLTINYKLTTTARTMGKEKSTGKMAAAKLTAYLETTDGELTDADFQEVTDYFYSYFQKKLKSAGIDTVSWSTIKGTDFYQNADGKTESNEEEKKNGQVWVTHNANKGNIMYGGGVPFAFGKIKKASRFCDDIGAPAGFFHLTVDFADIMVNVEIKSSRDPGFPSSYFPYTRTTSFKYHAATEPEMRIVPSATNNTLLWNEKQQSESIVLERDLKSKTKYHTALNQDPSRIRNRAFALAKSMDPVIIETTRAQYKAAAKKTLEQYADAFVAKTVALKND